MSNFKIRIDLLKLKGSFLQNVKGTSAVKKCIIIPVEDEPSIYVGTKGCYLNMTAIEVSNPQYGDTHMVKGDLPKAVREGMTQEQLRATPILGNLQPILPREQQQQPATGSVTAAPVEDEANMPF